MTQVYLVCDYETRSKAELSRVGVHEYAIHPSTQILCVAWRLGTFAELKASATKTQVWSPALPGSYGEFKRALLDPGIQLVAHNAGFEQAITKYVLPKLIHDERLKVIPIERWTCTLAMARALAFPGKLEHVCEALNLRVKKDMEGHRLMLKMSKPRRPTKYNPAIWHQKKSDLVRLMDYCARDIDAEIALFTFIPPLPEREIEIWRLDQKMNQRGFLCDRPAVTKILTMIDSEMARFKREVSVLTRGEIKTLGQRNVVLAWLKAHGLDLPNLQKKTVEDVLAAGVPEGPAKELLLLRQAASKTSTAKYEAFEERSRSDGRVRGTLNYHVASTGRWGGAGVQPQNFPGRGIIDNTDWATEVLLEPDTDLETLRLIWGNPLGVFSNLLRSMIRATPGKIFLGGDFAGIEVRVLFWIAKHESGLNAFSQDRDLYKEMATKIYNVKIENVTKAQREVGKRAILGLGYNMGKAKFFDTCKLFGQEVSEELAQIAVNVYRTVHYPVVQTWNNLERAAIAAVKKPGTRYRIKRTQWYLEGKYLYCELPSGRKLTYYGPEIRKKLTPWGETKDALYHWDVHPKTRKWVLNGTYGGKLTENVCQAIARDLMAESMIRAEKNGYELLTTVHVELLTERKDDGIGSVKGFENLMATLPDWAKGLPIRVEGWAGYRYRK